MSLARAWTRQLYGASGAAAVAPATIIAALAVLAVGGGFRGLGTLGRLFTGPAVAADSVAARPPGQAGSSGHPSPLVPVVAPPPSPPPAPPPTLIDRVVDLGTAVTSRVLGPVGTLGTRVLQTLGSTLDRIVPPVGRPPAAPVAPRALPGIRLP